ncbi:MAG: hypothetical protein H6643_00265 [Caldilineaceae bacterium]|nr:hypothetical protein [Caldilineaceae bacterium]
MAWAANQTGRTSRYRSFSPAVTFRYDAAHRAVWAEIAGQVVAGEAPGE